MSAGRNARASVRAELAAQIRHQRDVGDAALVDPLEDLPAVETGLAQVGQRLFQLVQFHAGDVQSGVVDHWRTLRKGEPSFYYAELAGPTRPSIGSRSRESDWEPVLEKEAASVIESRFPVAPAIPSIPMTYATVSGRPLQGGQ